MDTTLTTSQRKALDTLKAAWPFKVTPARTLIAKDTRRPVAIPAIIETGINSKVLVSLRDLGLVDVRSIWLRGHTSTDLVVTDKGELA